jgi:hypothetical protein
MLGFLDTGNHPANDRLCPYSTLPHCDAATNDD